MERLVIYLTFCLGYFSYGNDYKMSYQSKIDFWIFNSDFNNFIFLYTLYTSINTATFYELLIISIIYLIIFYIIWLPIFNTVYHLKDTSIEVKSMFLNGVSL